MPQNKNDYCIIFGKLCKEGIEKPGNQALELRYLSLKSNPSHVM